MPVPRKPDQRSTDAETPSSASIIETRRSKITLVAFLLLLTIFIGLTITMVAPYLIAVLMGGILALLARPVYNSIRSKGLPQRLAASLVTLGILLLVIGPLTAFGFLAVKQAISIGEQIASLPGLTFQGVIDRITHWAPVESLTLNAAEIEAQVKSLGASAAQKATALVLKLASSIPQLLLQMALVMLSCYFFLVDSRKFLNWLGDKVPLDPDVRQKLYSSFHGTAVSTIWATLAAASAQAAAMVISYAALGLPAAFLAGGATFIFAWIPMVGSTPVWLVGAIALFAQGTILKAILMVAAGLFTGQIDNVIPPMILKGPGQLHPLISLLAIFGGIEMFGLVGVFIGPVIAAVLLSLFETWPTVARRFGLIRGTRDHPLSATPGLTTRMVPSQGTTHRKSG